MDIKITTLGGKDAGKVKLSEEIFGLDPREDILQRVVRWQLAKKQQGTHKAKGRAEIARTGAGCRCARDGGGSGVDVGGRDGDVRAGRAGAPGDAAAWRHASG